MLRRVHMRMLSVAAIAAVVIASRGAAMETEDLPFCYHACVTGGPGGQCPSQADIDYMCSEAGCSVGGCAANWGNCQGGYIVQCNEEAN